MRFIAQEEGTECGLACLAMLADHYGLHADMLWMREKCGHANRGLNMSELCQNAAKLGLLSNPVKVELEDTAKLPLPCILHWKGNHFVVLKKVGRRRLVICDPAFGVTRMTWDRFSATFTGIALLLSPGAEFEKLSAVRNVSWRKIFPPVVGTRTTLFQVLMFSGYIEFCAILMPLLGSWQLDKVVPTGNLGLFAAIIVGYCVLNVVRAITQYNRSRALNYLTSTVSLEWGYVLLNKLLALPLGYIERRGVAYVMSRFDSYRSIIKLCGTAFIEMFLDALTAALSLAFLIWFSAKMALAVILFFVFYMALRYYSVPFFIERQAAAIDATTRLNTHFFETMQGVAAIRLHGGVGLRMEEYFRRASEETILSLDVKQALSLYGCVSGIFLGSKDVLVSAMGIYDVLNHAMSVGTFVAALTYATSFSVRANSLLDKLIDLKTLSLHVSRVAEISEEPPEFDPALHIGPSMASPPSIEFRSVSFRYAPHEPLVLRDLSFSVAPGEAVAIAGRSGAGKTTILKLILGIYQPTSGTILINGVPLSEYGIERFRQGAGTVLQDDVLFSGTIRDNIAFFDSRADMERVEQAARAASIETDILAMPMKYLTRIGGLGSTLSGGQKQRVILARAIFRDPYILLLDEATSHLDTDNERVVCDALEQSKATRVVIAHRRETIERADRVVYVG